MAKPSKLAEIAREMPLLGSAPGVLSDDRVIAALRKEPLGVKALAAKLRRSQKDVKGYLAQMQHRGVLVYCYGGKWAVEKEPHPVDHGLKYTYHSRPDHTYVFGAISDTHLGSKYERLDVLNGLYDHFEAAGVDRVFHGGNWIDGEARINRHELNVFGLDGQCAYFAEQYPAKPSLVTYAISGDCHEGWFGKESKLDTGRHLERIMEEHGREDWRNLGFLESNVPLKNAASGKTSYLALKHPAGGTAYAISYKPQKIVEAIPGGEKPAVLLVGHFHKAEQVPIRNVMVFQLGCTQDQCTWTRKHNIQPVVGGWIIRLRQDPRTGAICGAAGEWFHYFNRGYYNDRWSPSGPVKKPVKVQGIDIGE